MHTASLGHVGINSFGDRPDEKDSDIMEFTKIVDPDTNVMIQRGKSGHLSTTNRFQFQKVERQVKKDLNGKTKEEKHVIQ